MPADTPLVDLKGEKLLEPSEREGATLEATNLGQIIGLHIEMGRNVHWNNSNTVFVSQTQYLAG